MLCIREAQEAIPRPPRQTEKAAKCPEPLCPTRVLPPLGRRDPSPERTLLLRLRSYRLIRRSRWALSSFGFWPRLESPCSLLPVPAAHGSFPTLSPTVCSWMLDPLPRRYTVCSHLFLPRCHRPSPEEKWVGFPQLSRLKRLRAGGFSRLQTFRYVPASKFACPPDRPLYVADCSANKHILLSSEENGEPLSSLWQVSPCGRLGPVFQAPLSRLDGILGRA